MYETYFMGSHRHLSSPSLSHGVQFKKSSPLLLSSIPPENPFSMEVDHYPPQHHPYNHTASTTSIALNPSAPSFIPSHRNPNPYLSYYPYPVYLQIQPQYISYQCFSFPSYCATFQLISPPCTPALPPVPRCSIQELDENLGPEISCGSRKMVEPKPTANTSVVNCRRTRAPMSKLTVMHAPRCLEPRKRSSVKVSHRKYQIREDADFELGWKTTLMIKNIPGKFRKGSLLAILRDHCIEENQKARASEGSDEAVLSEFDFFYLPIDFRTNSNFGYAFVNFTSPVGARRLFRSLHNHHWISAGSKKVCQLNFARIQGLVASIEHADQMVFNRCVPDMYLPVHFEPPYNGLNESVEYIHGQKIM